MTEQSEAKSGIELTDLRDRPDMLGQVIEQNYEQWHEFADLDRDDMKELFRLDVPRGELPVHLVALIDGRYAGEVSLRARSMGSVKYPEVYLEGKSPWLSNMWVAPWARGQGLATKMTRELDAIAKALGYTRIYSSTEFPDSLYHKAGYRDIERRTHKGRTIYLIYKDL
jgi:ribosomal protein S18 acetylase RimI-like enzyme